MKPAIWFGIIFLYTIIAIVCAYFVPSSSPLWFLTVLFGTTFVAVLPGYCLVSFLFEPGKLDFIEQTVLSVALSFSIAGISGLFLGLSPIGITPASVINTLGIIELLLAVLAFLRKINVITPQKLSFRKPKPPPTLTAN